jgi:hypothetical protein
MGEVINTFNIRRISQKMAETEEDRQRPFQSPSEYGSVLRFPVEMVRTPALQNLIDEFGPGASRVSEEE